MIKLQGSAACSQLTLHILSTIIVICLSVKIGFAVDAEEEAEEGPASLEALAGAAPADIAAEAVLMAEASSIIGSGDDGGDDLSPMEKWGAW